MDSTTTKPTPEKKETNYIFYDKMDDANKKAMNVLSSQGLDAAIKHMFTDQDTGRNLTYGEMRARYG